MTAPTARVETAVIVAAGLGTRLVSAEGVTEVPKTLQPLHGRPILAHILDAVAAAGLREVVIVTGHLAEVLEGFVPRDWKGVALRTVHNPDFRLGNGVSLYCGAQAAGGDFILLMSDHLFEVRTLTSLIAAGRGSDWVRLVIDRKISTVLDLDDATKVRTDGGQRVLDIAKTLQDYDAIDTGMFLIGEPLTQCLAEIIEARGDASISEAMTTAIGAGRMGALDLGDAAWQDIDTPEMFDHAEGLVRRGRLGALDSTETPRHGG